MRTEQRAVATYEPVAAAEPQRAARMVRVPSVLRCALMIATVKLMLKTRDFSGTAAWIRRRVEGVPEATGVDPAVVKAAEWSVATAGALYPGRAKCLEQSLTLYYLLRRQGVAVRYCQGMQPYPFQAHAWVEYRGEVINDVPEHAVAFSRLPDQLP
jgi:hypothetical protein